MVARLEALGGEVARGAVLGEHDVVVLAAGRRLVGRGVGDRVDRVAPVLLGLGLRGLGGLHVGGERLGAGQQVGLLVALGLRDQLAELLLLARAAARSRRSPCAGPRRPRGRRRPREPDRPRFSWAARRESGSSRSSRGSITSRGYRGGRDRFYAAGGRTSGKRGDLGRHGGARLAVRRPLLAALGQVVGRDGRLVGAEDPRDAVGVGEAGAQAARARRAARSGPRSRWPGRCRRHG